MDIEHLHDLFKTPAPRWFERLDRGGIVILLAAAGSLAAWLADIQQFAALVLAVIVSSLTVGLGAAMLLGRELYRERCAGLVRERLQDLDIGLLNAVARAPELPEKWRRVAMQAMLERSCGRAMLLT